MFYLKNSPNIQPRQIEVSSRHQFICITFGTDKVYAVCVNIGQSVCTLVQSYLKFKSYLDLRSERLEDVLCAHMTCYSDPKLTLIFPYISSLCFSMMYCVKVVSEIVSF